MFEELAGKSAAEVIQFLELQPLEVEGGFWLERERNSEMNKIWYLMTPAGFSAMHKLSVNESWQWLAGANAEMWQLLPSGDVVSFELSPTEPTVLVSSETWQGARTCGEWTLVSYRCEPAFTDDCFTLGDASSLVSQFPAGAKAIEELTR